MNERTGEKASHRLWVRLLGTAVSFGCVTACERTSSPETRGAEADFAFPSERWPEPRIPHTSDWVDRGTILEQGEPGAWDHLLYGGFTGTVIKRDGTLFLYYQGARAFDEELQTVTDRAIGVATSQDGLRFEKSASNPVVTWQPNDGPEEGAVSGAALAEPQGQVVLYYGGNTQINRRNVRADGRLALSDDGILFSDHGVVLGHADSARWGFGDELFPILALSDGGDVYVYYVPSGSRRRWRLSVAWGPAYTDLRWSGEVQAPAADLNAWSMASAVRLGARRYAVFLNQRGQPGMQVRLVDLERPWRVSETVRTYDFDNMASGIVFRDEETQVWYLYYLSSDFSGYGVRTASLE